ncbi:hypothetical protein PG987_008913 [Apiospora arundinis]
MNIRIIDAYPLDIQHNNNSPASLPSPGVDYRSAAMAGQTGAEPLPGLEGILGSIAALNDTARNGISTKFNQLSEQNRQLKEQNRNLQKESRDQPNEQDIELKDQNRRLEEQNRELNKQNRELEEQNRELNKKNREQDETYTKAIADHSRRVQLFQPLQNALYPPPPRAEEFSSLIANVVKWVDDQIISTLNAGGEYRERALVCLKEDPSSGSVFTDAFRDDKTLMMTAQLPRTETEIAEACVLRWLTAAVFGEGLRAISPQEFDILERCERSLTTTITHQSVSTKLIATRGWRAQAFNAWINTQEYQSARQAYTRDLSKKLASGVRMFTVGRVSSRVVALYLHENIIEPWWQFMERMMSTRGHWLVEYTSHREANFGWEEYMDLTNNRKLINAETPLKNGNKQMTMLSAIHPGLHYRDIEASGTGEAHFQESQAIVKQTRLVAWHNVIDHGLSEQALLEKLIFEQDPLDKTIFSYMIRHDKRGS